MVFVCVFCGEWLSVCVCGGGCGGVCWVDADVGLRVGVWGGGVGGGGGGVVMLVVDIVVGLSTCIV